MLCYSRKYLSGLISQINFQSQKFVRALYFFGDFDLRHTQIHFREVINSDRRQLRVER